ncbi:MAG: hypothetical protein IJJ26_13725 [Victivallales bacterium]|nr:hypothetical protein [Victivallales bacterium]
MKFSLKKWCVFWVLVCLGGLRAEVELGAGKYEWLSHIRKEHPRMLFTKETLPALKARAFGEAKFALEWNKKKIDELPSEPKLDWDHSKLLTLPDGTLKFKPPNYMLNQCMNEGIGGRNAAVAAFLYLITEDAKYLEAAKKWMFHSLDVYEWANKHQLMVEWAMREYIQTLYAYDWLWNVLSPEERTRVYTRMVQITRFIQSDNRDVGRGATYRRNGGGYKTGFYGVGSLRFYTGLAGYGDGIDDQAAETLLKLGYDDHCKMMDFREEISGDQGALVSYTLMYSLNNYPPTSIRFLFMLQSAAGIDGSTRWQHLRLFPNWVFWNLIPDKVAAKEFGAGDGMHKTNNVPAGFIPSALYACLHLYGKKDPQMRAMCQHLLNCFPPKERIVRSTSIVLLPFLLTDLPAEQEGTGALPKEGFRHFPGVGEVFFRSGHGVKDTYALFLVREEGSSIQHHHYDQGHFTIYRRGFLALDSGTRGWVHNYQLPFYYSQTVAHNSLLIHMPDEKMPPYWGEHHEGKYPEPRPKCHGGQDSYEPSTVTTGSQEEFAFVRADMSKAYNAKKCEAAVREFFHLRPDLFLVVDRVVSTKPEYLKQWLIHSQNEPKVDGTDFAMEHGKGRLRGRVLWPEQYRLEKIGGPGKDFWASGKNWELHPELEKDFAGALIGHWRLELSPAVEDNYALFVNLLLAEDVEAPQQLPAVTRKLADGRILLDFDYAGKHWSVTAEMDSVGKTTIKVQ